MELALQFRSEEESATVSQLAASLAEATAREQQLAEMVLLELNPKDTPREECETPQLALTASATDEILTLGVHPQIGRCPTLEALLSDGML